MGAINKYSKSLTVKELIELLQEMPQDKFVIMEGCDCYGDAGGVVIENCIDGEEVVCIKRTI